MQEVALPLIAAYAAVFVQRWDQYAVQQRDGSYWRVTEPLSLSHLAAHLAGQWTLGTYVLDALSQCSFAVFDADSGDGLARLAELAEQLLREGVPTLLEASRRGGHLWVHLFGPTSAQVVRAWLLPYAVEASVELYPKQDWLAPFGSGSLIRLPFGIHQQSRGWYPFVRRSAWGEWVPVGKTVVECCTWACQQVQRVAVPQEVMLTCTKEQSVPGTSEMGDGMEAPAHMASHWGHGGYRSIREWCHSQHIEAVIGRYIALDGQGVGSCPFKEHHYRGDLRPSFQVFGGSDPHWYCYTWRRAGDLFDFLCLYYHLTPHEAWQRLRQGGLW